MSRQEDDRPRSAIVPAIGEGLRVPIDALWAAALFSVNGSCYLDRDARELVLDRASSQRLMDTLTRLDSIEVLLDDGILDQIEAFLDAD